MGKKQWAVVFLVLAAAMLLTGIGSMINHDQTSGIGRILACICLIVLAAVYWKNAAK
jgi:Na+/proline symporter